MPWLDTGDARAKAIELPLPAQEGVHEVRLKLLANASNRCMYPVYAPGVCYGQFPRSPELCVDVQLVSAEAVTGVIRGDSLEARSSANEHSGSFGGAHVIKGNRHNAPPLRTGKPCPSADTRGTGALLLGAQLRYRR